MNNLKAAFPPHTIFKRVRPRATGGVKEGQEGGQRLVRVCWLAILLILIKTDFIWILLVAAFINLSLPNPIMNQDAELHTAIILATEDTFRRKFKG